VDSTPTPGQPNDNYSVISGRVHGAFSQVFDSVTVTASGVNGHCNGFPDGNGVYTIGGLGPGKYAVNAHGRYQGYEYRGGYPESVEVSYSQTHSGTDVGINGWPWVQRESVPTGPKKKKVKDGGCLACLPVGDTDYVFALKGGKTYEFYRYNPLVCAWVAKESVPAIGRTGFNLPISKGAAMTAAGGKIYILKGGNTLDFYQYDPAAGNVYPWQQMWDLPTGAFCAKYGSGLAPVTIGETTWVYCLKGSGTSEFYRYNTITYEWQQMSSPPQGPSAKAFGKGSGITSDGTGNIWALKGRYDEFFAYDAASDEWTYEDSLPSRGRSGKKKKASDGAALAYCPSGVYALKGGNTVEFWRYDVAQGTWYQQTDMPLPPKRGKKVKAGGALAYAPDVNALYALKGGSTREFWSYTPDSFFSLPAATQDWQHNLSSTSSRSSLRVSPNPPRHATTVSYEVPVTGRVTLGVYDLSGKRRCILAGGIHQRGSYHLTWDVPSAQPAGVCFIRLDTPGGSASQKIILQR
jgi:hypothetical protein